MRYRLTERAYIADAIREPGTIIGPGTDVPFDGAPAHYMEPLDGGEAVKRPADPVESLPLQEGEPVKRGPGRPRKVIDG